MLWASLVGASLLLDVLPRFADRCLVFHDGINSVSPLFYVNDVFLFSCEYLTVLLLASCYTYYQHISEHYSPSGSASFTRQIRYLPTVTTNMFSSLTTKIALRKLGLNSDSFNFAPANPEPKPKKLSKNAPPGTVPGLDDEDDGSSKWPAWMTVKSLPLTVQPWLSPRPPPIPVATECPKPGDLAPLDRDRKLTFGGGKKVLVVFLRCVGCACKPHIS